MMTAFLDSCFIIALLNSDDDFHQDATKIYQKEKLKGALLISDIVYAECAAGYTDKEKFDEALWKIGIERWHLKDNVLFRAGKALSQYRKNRRQPITQPVEKERKYLPDFIIGATAEEEKLALITFNEKDFKPYFTLLEIICLSSASEFL